jgi:hypothetical protein
MEKPLACYKEETGLGYYRQFDLYPEHVEIKTGFFRSRMAELKIPLKYLIDEPNKIYARHPGAATAFVLCLTAAFIFIFNWEIVGLFSVSTIAAYGSIAAVLTVLLAYRYRKLEYASFSNISGMPGIDIARSGKDRKKFDGFVKAVSEQIKSSKSCSR